MQSDEFPEPESAAPRPSAGWLNKIIWVILSGCFLAALFDNHLALVMLLLVLPWLATLGAAFNLVMGMWLLAAERTEQAKPYFIGFAPLALLACWLWYEVGHMGKFGGG